MNGSWTAERVHNAFQAATRTESPYSAMLPFFESVYLLQEAGVASARPSDLPRVEACGTAAGSDQPLASPAQMPIDWPNTLDLLERICDQALSANPQLSETARRLSEKLQHPGNFFESAWRLLIEDKTTEFAAVSDTLGTSAHILAFMLFNSVWPSIAQYKARAAETLDRRAWAQGYCPLCGRNPFIAILDNQGRRELVCSFCRYQWPAKRIECPFCGNSDANTLSYFYSGEEKAYRVHTCQRCRHYVKCVDTRELDRPCYAPLEAILTAHLDHKALQLGFRNGLPVWMAI